MTVAHPGAAGISGAAWCLVAGRLSFVKELAALIDSFTRAWTESPSPFS